MRLEPLPNYFTCRSQVIKLFQFMLVNLHGYDELLGLTWKHFNDKTLLLVPVILELLASKHNVINYF